MTAKHLLSCESKAGTNIMPNLTCNRRLGALAEETGDGGGGCVESREGGMGC